MKTLPLRWGFALGLITAILSASACAPDADAPDAMPSLTSLPFGAVKPNGWIATQLQRDLEQGFVGHLDQLVPDLIIEDDIYSADRLTNEVTHKDVGAVTEDGGEWQVQFLWWNSETQGNWWDGYVRHALLTEHAPALQQAEAYVEAKLATLDPDGYIGIYGRDLRYQHATENGELWAQTTLFRALLAYYEATDDARVLTAVERAVRHTMEQYPRPDATPFDVTQPFAGIGHGLMFTDVLYRLHQLTGQRDYIDYALFLFEDYNRHDLAEVDIHIDNLLDSTYRFQGHGVHTYEHLRTLTLAARYSDDPVYDEALTAYLARLEDLTTPSGAPIGDEWIAGRLANADDTGYEYCSLHELLHAYAVLLESTGEAVWADKIEWLLYNAGQGARHPDGRSIAYCKTDNSYHALGALRPEDVGEDGHNRYKYSPAHQDVAVCCVPNAGRIYPYFVQSMWMRSATGVVAQLYGPSTLQTEVAGTAVTIQQVTDYPFTHSVTFEITTDAPTTFDLTLRKPGWASAMEVDTDAAQREAGPYVHLTKRWTTGDRVTVSFSAEPTVGEDRLAQRYVSHGPLLFALPLQGQPRLGKAHLLDGFFDQFIDPVASAATNYWWPVVPDFQVQANAIDPDNPWGSAWTLTGTFYDPLLERDTTAQLVPMGGTTLRRVAFPLHTPAAGE